MTNRPTFNMRLRQYDPLGAPSRVLPDEGLSLSSTPEGPTLQATLSTVICGALPDHVEVAVEVWDEAAGAWREGLDSRFVINTQDGDDRDRTGTVSLTGVGLPQWLAQRAALAGVEPYQDAGQVEAAASTSSARVSGTTFTWGAHILGVGDRVRITDAGGSKGLSSGSVYYVRNPGTSTFQLSHTPTGAIMKFGASTKVHMERVRTRIKNLDGHKFAKNQAVSVWDADGSNLTNGSQYYVVNPTPSTIQVATKPGGIPEELKANALTVYRYLDGQRMFNNMTPGNIIGNAFLEARDRGWGQDAAGVDQVFHSWTNAGDSNSLAWPARVDDPTVTGVSVGFQPGTSLWAMTQFMIENDWAEFAFQGRTFHLFAPNTGTDYGDPAGKVCRIGSSAQQLKVSKDLTDYRTAETVRGEGPVEVTAAHSRSPWGRLELYTTAAGVTSNAQASTYANGDLTKNAAPAIGYTVTEAAQEAAFLPILDYQRGDWVQVQLAQSTDPSPTDYPAIGSPAAGPSLHLAGLAVMQCAVRSRDTGEWYVTQIHTEANGDESTRISRLSASGALLDNMLCTGGGHGTSIALEYTAGKVNVWMTWQRTAIGGAVSDDVVRFPYKAGTFLRKDVPGLEVVIPGGGTYRNLQFDWANGYAVVRTPGSSTETYTRHPLEDVLAGNLGTAINSIRLPMLPPTVQGFSTYQGALFRYTGAQNNPAGDKATLSEYSWTTGKLVTSVDLSGLGKVRGAYPGNTGEPESATVYDAADGSGPRLYVGVTMNVSGSHTWPVWSMNLTPAKPTRSNGWSKLRVTQWTLQKGTDGTVQATVLLEKKKRALLHKLAGAAKKANGGRATTGSSTTPAESDNRKAAKPSTLALSSRTVHMADKSTKATVTAVWLPVTQDENGNSIVGHTYEVMVRTAGEQNGKAVATTKGTTADLHGYAAGQTIAVSVRAQSSTGEWGELTDEVEHVVGGVEIGPDAPTAPVVVSTLGSVTVTWDGKLVDLIDGPLTPAAGFAYVAVQRSSDGGATWLTETQTLHAAGTVTDLGLTVGATYSYRLIAWDSTGNASPPSASASCAVVGIDVAQINAAFQKSMSDVASVSSNAQSIANQSAATAGQALTAANNAGTSASNALTAANGKNRNTYSTAGASGSGTAAGDLWFQVNGSGQITGQWTWTGTVWQSNQITGAVITQLNAGSITTGTLDAARISTRSISATQLAVADFTNLVPAPHQDFGGNPFWQGHAYTGGDVPVGNAWVCDGRDHTSTFDFPVKAGDSFYIEMTARNISGGPTSLRPALWAMNKDGNGGNGWAPWDLLNGVVFKTTVATYAGGWSRYSYQVTIPSTWTDIAKASVYMQIDQNPTGGATQWAVADLLYRRAMNAQLIVDGSITANALSATAINGMTITGATVQTASGIGSNGQGGVILNNGGITGYDGSGRATFRVDNAGNTSMTGQVNATSGTISGALTVSGALQTASGGNRAVMDGANGWFIAYNSAGDGAYLQQAKLLFSGSSTGYLTARELASNGTFLIDSNSTLTLNGSNGLYPAAELILGNDGSPFARSMSIWNRSYSGTSSDPGNAGSTGTTGFVVVTNAGTLGISRGYVQFPDAYNRTVTGRTAVVNPNGTLGYASSSARTKNLIKHIAMDDAALEVWLGLSTWQFAYKADEKQKLTLGVVAEEVHEAGFKDLVYYDESPESETPGQIDGFAYERMGVYNHLAIKRIYARLMAAEAALAALTAKDAA